MSSFLNSVKMIPRVNVIRNGIMYLSLKPFFVACFNRWGTVPRRKPVKIVRVSFGYVFSKINIILLNK